MASAYCDYCEKELEWWEIIFSSGRRERCVVCKLVVRKQMRDVRDLFRIMTSDGDLSPSVWQTFVAIAEQRKLDLVELRRYLQRDAIYLFRITCERIELQGKLSQSDENHLQFLRSALGLSHSDVSLELERVERVRKLMVIRQGRFEPIKVKLMLDKDEEAYHQVLVKYLCTDKHKVRTFAEQQGILTLTNKYIYFKSFKEQNRRSRVRRMKMQHIYNAPLEQPNRIHVHMTQGEGEGVYTVLEGDAEITQAYLMALVKQARVLSRPLYTKAE